MRFWKIYKQALGALGRDTRLAVLLGLANIIVAGLTFLDPVLFGRVIGLLTRSDGMPADYLWREASELLGIWFAVGAATILANIATALQSERMAHRNRLSMMNRYFNHVLSLPLSFHGDVHSGRLMKVMLGGSDALFGLWLTFFKDQLSTYVAVVVLLPLTFLMNWRLAMTLVVLVVLFVVLTILVVRRTEAGQRQVEHYHNHLAGTAQDALANVMVVQSFTRLQAESRLFGQIIDDVIRYQFPVLNWWAVVNVLTRAASTLAVIAIVVIGTILHIDGKASVGEIVSFMGFATLLIGRLESAVQFASRLFFQLPMLEDFFSVLDAKSSVPEKSDAQPLHAPQGEVAFEDVSFAYPGGPAILSGVSFVAKPGFVRGAGGADRGGQEYRDEFAAAAMGPGAGGHHDRRHRSASRDARKAYAPRSAWCSRRACCSTGRSARICASAGPGPRTRSWSGRAAWQTRTSSSSGSRTATTRWWASGGPRCPAGSGNDWRSRGHC